MNLSVAHFSLYYFELSENWIHTQIKYSDEWNPKVFTNHTKNLDSVHWTPPIYDRSRELSFPVRLLDSVAMKLIGYYPSFYSHLKRENFQLIHAHFGPMGYLCSGMVKRLNIPLITTFYGYDASLLPEEKPEWKSKYRKLFERGTRFLVEGPAMGEKLEALGCPPEKIVIHHLGVEINKHKPKKNYLASYNLRLLMVGRFVEKKGFIYGLRAFHQFLKEGGAGILTIYGDSNGTTESEEVKKELLDYVKRHGLQDSVILPGLISLDKLQWEYCNHDVFMAPSVRAKDGDDEGGAPVTIIEASASGLPVIGSRHCDIPEVVQHEKTGLLCEEKNVGRLSQHIFQLYQHPDLQKKLGKNGSAYIQEYFCARKQGEKLSSIYLKCHNNTQTV